MEEQGSMKKNVPVGMGWVLSLGAMTLLSGCSGFFSTPPSTPATGSGSGSGSTSGDYVYVVNELTNSLTGFGIGAGTLAPISTYSLNSGLVPNAVAVTIPNTFVYVAGLDTIQCFAIGIGGALTACSGGNATMVADFVSLDVSTDGNWLLAIDNNPLTPTLYVFSINASTGALTSHQSLSYNVPANSGTIAQRQVRISPNNAIIAVALGPGGDTIFTFNTTTGVATQGPTLPLSNASDNAVAFDATSSYLFLARGAASTNGSGLGVVSFSIANNGGLTQVGSTAASGHSPYALVLDGTGAFVYAGNRADSTISGYGLASGALTALAGSPYASGNAVTALARDRSGKYIVAVSSGGASDVTMYSLGQTLTGGVLTPTGVLSAEATAASGTDPSGSIAIAATH